MPFVSYVDVSKRVYTIPAVVFLTVETIMTQLLRIIVLRFYTISQCIWKREFELYNTDDFQTFITNFLLLLLLLFV